MVHLTLLHPATRVTAVRVDPKASHILWIHLIDYILQGNHAVFEHPIPGVFLSMATVVQINVLYTFYINLGSFSSLFDLRQDRLGVDDGVGVSKEDALEAMGEVEIYIIIPTRSLVKNLLHDVHVD